MLTNILLFSITSFLLIIVPGPDTAVITRNTIVHKKSGGFKTLMGTLLAISVHTIAAIVGLSAIIMQSAIVFTIFKYVGAAYLIYLGIKALLSIRQRNNTLKAELEELPDGVQDNRKSLMLQGFSANILNPKVAVFFLTFFPQFVNPQTDTFFTFVMLGVVYLFIKFAWFGLFIYIIDLVRAWMKKEAVKKAIDGLTGAIFIVFGLRLALEEPK
ncbi:LysE family translocator [Cytobacillus purgationiresistens]|uniref:RhtB (Resistance to homoserine/threonine) family protein n=1 Tax=Cytobacillus purgationiresistens TaxID=863449 RepID=A0ABU0AJ28_9BACI|nr:LysE family translocator [Cytobacillus purgationiresistens]MDQ0270874.1 RhtB (resistance to homoserine/threonine) family protein [Cytobacillus purgationiresistens]